MEEPTTGGTKPRKPAARKRAAARTEPPAEEPKATRRTSAAAVRTDTATTAVSPRRAAATGARPSKATGATRADGASRAGDAASKAGAAGGTGAARAARAASGTGKTKATESAAPVKRRKPAPATKPAPHDQPTVVETPGPPAGDAVAPAVAAAAAHEPAPLPAPPAEPARERRVPLWARLVADPGFATQHAAREAVRRLGPEARDWVARMRERYPAASPDALARLAVAEFGRAAWRHTALTSAAGVLGSVGATGVIAQEQARLVLAVAASYGIDATAPERSSDLLELLRLPRLNQPALPALGNAGRLLAGVAARRVAARLIPFGAAIAGALQGSRGSDDVARRAVAHYRTRAATQRSF